MLLRHKWPSTRMLLLFSAVYLCTVWPVYGQALPSIAQTPSQPESTISLPNDFPVFYRFFMEVGEEDGRIQQAIRSGSTQVPERTDYGRAINVSRGAEKTIVALALEFYHWHVESRRQNDDEWNQRVIAWQRAGGPDTGTDMPKWPFEDWAHAYGQTLGRTLQKLRQTLDPKDFASLDTYLNSPHERPSANPDPQEQSRPIPENFIYELFMAHVAGQDARVRREVQAGKMEVYRDDYSEIAHFERAKEAQVIDTVLAASKRLDENEKRGRILTSHWRDKDGRPLSNPPQVDLDELREISLEHTAIVEGLKDQLKELVGPDTYANLDAWIKNRYGSGTAITVRVPDNHSPSN